jgi:pyruvate,water dikinase
MSDQNHQMQIKPGQPIPSPDNFPVTWENPDDQDLLWTFDRYHYPSPLAPLEYELIDVIYENGARKALSEIDVPFQMINRRINTYFYRAYIPKATPPDGVIRMMNIVRRFAPGVVKAIESKAVAAMTNTYLPKLKPLIDDLDATWNENYLPEIKACLAEWESFDPEDAPKSELLAHLDKVLVQAERIGELHFLIFGPYIFAMSEFEEYFGDLFSTDGDNFVAYRLLQGFDNMILVGDRALWDLGRKALTMPAVQRILEEKEAKDVIRALEESAAGQVFLGEFNAFLREHGQRGAMYSAIGEVSWIEDPTPAIKMLKNYITQPDRDLVAELAAESAERERHMKEVRARLKGYPQPVVEKFERLLKAAQIGTVLHSDHGYWIDYRAMYSVRRVLLALGRWLSKVGAIDQPNDVLFLWLDELRASAQDPNQANLRGVVAERKAEMAHFATIKPPAILGTMPLMSPPTDEPLFRTMAKASGEMMIPSVDGKPGVLYGNAGSPGIVRGPAKVVRSIKDAGKLQPGDILVAETTAPPWTPLFATAIAIVTDAGGILSHCAVVAREYGIPAVVGTRQATVTIQDGQMIEVNGDNGEVRILEPV